MKVTTNIPKSMLKGLLAIANMDGTLSDEQVEEISNTPEVDITDALSKNDEAKQMIMALGLVAIGVIGEQKFPDL